MAFHDSRGVSSGTPTTEQARVGGQGAGPPAISMLPNSSGATSLAGCPQSTSTGVSNINAIDRSAINKSAIYCAGCNIFIKQK